MIEWPQMVQSEGEKLKSSRSSPITLTIFSFLRKARTPRSGRLSVIDAPKISFFGQKMTAKKISGIVLLLLGIVIFVVGSYQYDKSQTPDTCIVSFTKSLGGKASMDFRDSVQRSRNYGISGISIGVIFTLAGSVLLFKTRKKRF